MLFLHLKDRLEEHCAVSSLSLLHPSLLVHKYKVVSLLGYNCKDCSSHLQMLHQPCELTSMHCWCWLRQCFILSQLLPAQCYASTGICYGNSICLSVHLSVCVSHSCFVPKRLNISSEFFYHLIAPSFSFFVTLLNTDGFTRNRGKGGWENCNFWPISLSILEKQCEIQPQSL